MTEQLFFELIRVSIGTQRMLSRMPSAQEWQALYEMAKKQSLVGVCFAGVKKVLSNSSSVGEDCSAIGLPELLYLKWMGMAAKIQKRNEVLNRQCVELQERLRKDGFRSYIMKGQGNAALYGDLQMLRQSGDIDVLLEGDFKKVYGYVQGTCPTKEVNRLEIQYHCFDDTEVEIHYKPFYMPRPNDDRILQEFFAMCSEVNFTNKINLIFKGVSVIPITAPVHEFNLVHQLVHIWHHFFTEGIGMRQLMDYCFVLRAANKEITIGSEKFKEVKAVVSKLGLEHFAAGLMDVMQTVFGMKEEYLLWHPNPEAGAWLLHEVLKTGNFGKMDESGVMKNKTHKRLWLKTKRAWKYRQYAPLLWFWLPLRSSIDRVWMWKHGFKM